jgi:hypothetical protein
VIVHHDLPIQPYHISLFSHNISEFLSHVNRHTVQVPGDGFCLLHAWGWALWREHGIDIGGKDEICNLVKTELERHWGSFYHNFSTLNEDVMDNLQKYFDKGCNSDT